MAGRPKHYEDANLIDQATKVFWQKGYSASSAKDLMKAMNIGQGSFYLSFKGGKKELYRKSLIQFSNANGKIFNAELEKSDDPIKFIKDFFYASVNYTDERKKNGCYLGNAIIELSNLDEETKKLSAELLSKLKDNFENILIKAKEEGKLAPNKSPSLIAKHLINLWNGINVTQRMNANDEELEEIIKMNLEILD